jgi:hypothetical protein
LLDPTLGANRRDDVADDWKGCRQELDAGCVGAGGIAICGDPLAIAALWSQSQVGLVADLHHLKRDLPGSSNNRNGQSDRRVCGTSINFDAHVAITVIRRRFQASRYGHFTASDCGVERRAVERGSGLPA